MESQQSQVGMHFYIFVLVLSHLSGSLEVLRYLGARHLTNTLAGRREDPLERTLRASVQALGQDKGILSSGR